MNWLISPRNTVRDCVQWGAQFQGESGGMAQHSFHGFGEGIPAVDAEAAVTFTTPGTKRVTLVVWDATGQGNRVEKQVAVGP